MRKFLKPLLVLISIATGVTFLFSAYTKSYTPHSFEGFELSIVEYSHLPWLLSAFISRFFIGLETTIGILLVMHVYGKNKWVLKLAMGMLIMFSIYLIYLWVIAGNNINCECFGDAVSMTPSTSLIKNAVLLLLLYILLRYHNQLPFRWNNLLASFSIIAITSIPYFYIPIPSGKPQWLREKHYYIDLSILYKQHPGISVDLMKGKYILAFFNPNCHHCQIAAYKMHLMKENNPALPFFMVIGGVKDASVFFEKSKAQNIPYVRMETNSFIKLSGTEWPVIDWLNNGWVEARSTYVSLDEGEIEKWLKQSK